MSSIDYQLFTTPTNSNDNTTVANDHLLINQSEFNKVQWNGWSGFSRKRKQQRKTSLGQWAIPRQWFGPSRSSNSEWELIQTLSLLLLTGLLDCMAHQGWLCPLDDLAVWRHHVPIRIEDRRYHDPSSVRSLRMTSMISSFFEMRCSQQNNTNKLTTRLATSSTTQPEKRTTTFVSGDSEPTGISQFL